MSILKGRPKPPIPELSTGQWITVLPSPQGPTEYEVWLISNGCCGRAHDCFDPQAGVEKIISLIGHQLSIGYESLVISEKVLNEWPDTAEGRVFCEYCRNETHVVPLAFHDQFLEMIEDMKKKVTKRQRTCLPAYYAPFFEFV